MSYARRFFLLVVLASFAMPVGVASAVPAPAPRFVPGNVTTCQQAGLAGDILFGSSSGGNASDVEGGGTLTDPQTLSVTINPGWTATGIVVKGGPNTNVYDGPFVGPVTVTGLQAPVTAVGATPEINHWFVCGVVQSTPQGPGDCGPPGQAISEAAKVEGASAPESFGAVPGQQVKLTVRGGRSPGYREAPGQ